MSDAPDQYDHEQNEFLWNVCQQYRELSKHSEEMRSNLINYILAIAAALIALIGNEGITKNDLSPSVMLMIIGLFGILSSSLYTEKYEKDRERASFIQNKLEERFFKSEKTLSKLKENADKKHYERKFFGIPLFSILSDKNNGTRKRAGLRHLTWIGLPLIVFAFGAFFSFSAIADLVGCVNAM